MSEINIGKGFSIDSSEKCATAEGVYLAIKSGDFDDKLETALKILHKNEKFLDVEDASNFRKLIFSIPIFSKQEDIKKILKEVFLGGRHKVFNEHFSKLLEEVIDNLLFKYSSVSDLSDSISEKVFSSIGNTVNDNQLNINQKLHGYSDLELFTYLFSDFKRNEISYFGALGEVKSRLEKNPKILESFLTSGYKIDDIRDLLIDLYEDYDQSTGGNLNLANRQSFQAKVVPILKDLDSELIGKLLNSFNYTVHGKELIWELLRIKNMKSESFLRELDESKDIVKFLKLCKGLNVSESYIYYFVENIFLVDGKMEDRVNNLLSFYGFLVDNNMKVKLDILLTKQGNDIFLYLFNNREKKPSWFRSLFSTSITELVQERYESQTKTGN